MKSTSVIEISKSALKNNLDFLQAEIGENVQLSSVVKGNAYGHGIKEFVPLAYECGIRHFSVFSADEAYEVASSCDDKYQVMIMGDVEGEALEWAIKNEIEFFVFELDRLEQSIQLAKKIKKPALVHIEVETGMNRTGFNKEQLKAVKTILKSNSDHLVFKGLCTHYAGAESIANYLRIQQQHKIYNRMNKLLREEDILPEKRHTACSAAMVMYPQTRMDMVRVGIMQYGFWPSPEIFMRFIGTDPGKQDPLIRVMSWKSRVIATKTINAGEFIGYGTSYLARNNMKVAVIPVGYAHGYSRTLSNQGRVLIRGHRMGVVGMINMNMLVADISEVPEVDKGDEVVLIGKQGDMSISVSSFSEFSHQLNYEMLTRLPQSTNRKIVE
ncbi:MAG: alanine racemase [Candidatus Cyclobacteriaceae bacterium M2_1C_046]